MEPRLSRHTGSIKVKRRSRRCQGPAAAVSPSSNIISPTGRGSGREGCHTDGRILHRTQHGRRTCAVVDANVYRAPDYARLSRVFQCFLKLQSPHTSGEGGTQVCVITRVIRPGYGPPASKWTLDPIRRRWQQRRWALADDGFDDGARRLCFIGRYFWLKNNLLELFNMLRTIKCSVQCIITHKALKLHVMCCLPCLLWLNGNKNKHNVFYVTCLRLYFKVRVMHWFPSIQWVLLFTH